MSNSINNRLFLEPYSGTKKIEVEVKKGFASAKAKHTLIGLKLLKQANVQVGQLIHNIPANTVVYFNETILATNPAYKERFVFDGSEEGFVMGFYHDAVFLEEV